MVDPERQKVSQDYPLKLRKVPNSSLTCNMTAWDFHRCLIIMMMYGSLCLTIRQFDFAILFATTFKLFSNTKKHNKKLINQVKLLSLTCLERIEYGCFMKSKLLVIKFTRHVEYSDSNF